MKQLKNTEENRQKLLAFYQEVCAEMQGKQNSAQWEFGIYPTAGQLEAYLEQGAFYVLEEQAEIAGALALVFDPVDGYEVCDWKVEEGTIATIHLFAVHPQHRRRHLGMRMLEELEREVQMDAIHLDCVRENEDAARMYRKAGFFDHGLHEIYYEDTGWQPYRLFEKICTKNLPEIKQIA